MTRTNLIPPDWQETTLGKISREISYGYTESASLEKIGPKFLRITDIQEDFINWNSVPYCKISPKDHEKYKLHKGDIVVARTGNSTGATAVINDQVDSVFASYLIRFRLDESKAYWKYIDYVLRSPDWKGFINGFKGGSAQGGINAKTLSLFELDLPSLEDQKKLAAILSSLDDKIELLRRQNKTLENMAQALFKEWFINFNFPDENGKLYKSSGGKMIDSELGKIPKGWTTGIVKDVSKIFDSKRVPLSGEDRDKRKGKYPYYGATEIMDYIDGYLFDGIYLLLAEDGSVMDDKGYSVLQYVWGKIWVNNHAHILQGNNGFSTEILYLLWKRVKVSGLITGAVQPKINQENLLKHEIIIPDKELLSKFDEIIQPTFTKLRKNTFQIGTLSRLRDTLLPKLMKGEIRVSQHE